MTDPSHTHPPTHTPTHLPHIFLHTSPHPPALRDPLLSVLFFVLYFTHTAATGSSDDSSTVSTTSSTVSSISTPSSWSSSSASTSTEPPFSARLGFAAVDVSDAANFTEAGFASCVLDGLAAAGFADAEVMLVAVAAVSSGADAAAVATDLRLSGSAADAFVAVAGTDAGLQVECGGVVYNGHWIDSTVVFFAVSIDGLDDPSAFEWAVGAGLEAGGVAAGVLFNLTVTAGSVAVEVEYVDSGGAAATVEALVDAGLVISYRGQAVTGFSTRGRTASTASTSVMPTAFLTTSSTRTFRTVRPPVDSAFSDGADRISWTKILISASFAGLVAFVSLVVSVGWIWIWIWWTEP